MLRTVLSRILGRPATRDSRPAGPPARCTRCGADWTAGRFSPGCGECGGGAMTRDCEYCQGRCGAVWQRAVIDSNDARRAHWVGACKARDEIAPIRQQHPHLRLFMFGYQTPQQIENSLRNPDWDDQDSQWVLIDAEDEQTATRLGFAYADAFVRRLFETSARGSSAKAGSWSQNPYANWFEDDPAEIDRAIVLRAAIITSEADIAALFQPASGA
jgi:hypothetical protein